MPQTKTTPLKGENFALIKLTHGFTAIVDLDDYEYLNQFFWQARKSFSRWYAMRRVFTPLGERWIRMHREIMNTPQGYVTHHKNRKTFDNRKSNLENMTQRNHKSLHVQQFPGRVLVKKTQGSLPRHTNP